MKNKTINALLAKASENQIILESSKTGSNEGWVMASYEAMDKVFSFIEVVPFGLSGADQLKAVIDKCMECK